ncbi:hypothetical protein CYMTET_24243 [Cymbomonas tetramitiformis]|uniref:Uncharacterized protein n=1 Tax=Cymbomonas tetramitiformis TaxID=36881 RepID=A0AAE0FWZ2_9CHLO|nr:hypothetical protein CYMTET_44805 [Cymbomonas tetramitiformis]KAK3267188.1 hypothetical protein CYMTET_24243 [Cymbomonas tetramitiformis]
MSKRQDKAKVVERSPPGLGVEPTYGELSEERKPDGLSVGEDSAALTTLIDERQQQLFSQQGARLNELMKMVQVLAQAVPQLAANQNAGTGNAIASPEAAESGMSGSSVKSRVASGTVGVPLPLLTDMLKGFKSDQLYSGQDAENDSKWLEFRGKIVPCLRHRALALLLSDARDLEDIKKDEQFSVAANQLFHDFLSAVTSKTANAVVQTYSAEADGVLAWRQLNKMRRSTGSAYFVGQVKTLLDDTKRFATLAPPLPGFLNARQVLDRVEEYACTSKFLPNGEKFHVASLEAVFVAMVLNSLNPAYVHIRTMFSGDELPSFQKLNDAVCDHYDNVIATSAAAMETGAGIVEDRREQHPGVDDTGEALFAISELVEDSMVASFSDDLPQFISGLEDTVTPVHLVFGGDSGKSDLVDPPSSGLTLSNDYSVLERVLAVPTDATARCAKVAGGVVDPDLRVALRSTIDKSAVLDCGATKHIFDSMKVFTEDDDGNHFGDNFDDNFDDSIPDLDSGSDSHKDDDPEACQLGLSRHPELYLGLRVDILTTYPVMIK